VKGIEPTTYTGRARKATCREQQAGEPDQTDSVLPTSEAPRSGSGDQNAPIRSMLLRAAPPIHRSLQGSSGSAHLCDDRSAGR
jgi:hypothetical protein